MNLLLPGWTLNTDVLVWFATTAIQVTLLSALVLLLARLAQRDAVIRHGILTIGLCLILISPVSTSCLQGLGFGIISLPAQTSSPESTSKRIATSRCHPILSTFVGTFA